MGYIHKAGLGLLVGAAVVGSGCEPSTASQQKWGAVQACRDDLGHECVEQVSTPALVAATSRVTEHRVTRVQGEQKQPGNAAQQGVQNGKAPQQQSAQNQPGSTFPQGVQNLPSQACVAPQVSAQDQGTLGTQSGTAPQPFALGPAPGASPAFGSGLGGHRGRAYSVGPLPGEAGGAGFGAGVGSNVGAAEGFVPFAGGNGTRGYVSRFGMGIPPLGAGWGTAGGGFGAGIGGAGPEAGGARGYRSRFGTDIPPLGAGWGAAGIGGAGGAGHVGRFGMGLGGAGLEGAGVGADVVRDPPYWLAEASLLTANAANTAATIAKQEPYATRAPRVLEYETQVLNADLHRVLYSLEAIQQIAAGTNPATLPALREAIGKVAAAQADAAHLARMVEGGQLNASFVPTTKSAATHLREAERLISNITEDLGAQSSPATEDGNKEPSGDKEPSGAP